jgi:hypothetical protein
VVTTHPFTSRSTLGLGTHVRKIPRPGHDLRSEGARPPAAAAPPFPWRRRLSFYCRSTVEGRSR